MSSHHSLLSFTAERPIVPYSAAEEDFFFLTTITAPELEEEELDTHRPPIDLSIVIDRSGSMSGTKIALVRETLKFLVNELTAVDRIGIVLFDTDVTTLLSLLPCTDENKVAIHSKIDSIQVRGHTFLSGGLFKGLEMLRQSSHSSDRRRLRSVFLLTDGEATRGLQETHQIAGMIRGEVAHPPIEEAGGGSLLQRHLRRKRLAKRLASGGGGVEATGKGSMAHNYVSDGISIYSFGFGSEHNEGMLKEIAQQANGVYYFLENVESIADSFVDCLGGLMSVVCKDLRLALHPQGGVRIKQVHTVYRQTPIAEGGVMVELPDLQSEEKRDILLQVSLPALPQQEVQWRGLAVHLDYKDKENNPQQEDLVGAVPRLHPADVGEEASGTNEVIVEQRNRVLAAQVATEAKRLADADQFDQARARVEGAIHKIEASAAGSRRRGLTEGIVADLREQCSNMNRSAYHRGGYRKKITAVQQEWGLQRSAAPKSHSHGYAMRRQKKKCAMRRRKARFFSEADE